eukprot:TRINITY_DN31844_c0_g1_i1.p1 TRINITY_DN31844_c0_g1~~TRINITY_DN31844_c0_g1_i1.p1  ORF type:complete len:344 (-),score=63.75 TRINITY_DN31844_c0_g1_i1:257-1288(-)
MSACDGEPKKPQKNGMAGATASSWSYDLANMAIFVLSVLIMATRPMLLYVTGDVGAEPMPVVHFQLAVEGTKIAICTFALASNRLLGKKTQFWRGWRYTLQFTPPALMYLVMNLLVVQAARMMNPPTFQLLANTKILCTAVASWVLLSKRIAVGQWCALLLLTVGVALGQWRGGGTLEAPPIGILICLFNGCISATAGVLMERILKAPASFGMTIFETALHTSLHTVVFNGLGLIASNPDIMSEFRWPSRLDGLALVNEATNGILMALLMRRLDSITKNFAFSTSVFATAGLSAIVLRYRPSWCFFLGAALAGASGILYTVCGVPAQPAAAPGVAGDKKGKDA